jgi:hypothetical protein
MKPSSTGRTLDELSCLKTSFLCINICLIACALSLLIFVAGSSLVESTGKSMREIGLFGILKPNGFQVGFISAMRNPL